MIILKICILKNSCLCFLIYLSFFSTQKIFAQRGWEIGANVGAAYYFGDLNTSFDLSHPGIALGVTSRFNFNERLCLKLSGTYGKIGADDKNSANAFERTRNLNFRSDIFDGGAQFEFNFLPYNYYDPSKRFSPYVFAGFNVYHFNPQGNLNGTWYDLAPLGTEGQFKGEEYYTTQLALNYGIGFKIALGEEWSINLELSARKLFTDYLDDVSTVYPSMNDLRKSRGPIAIALSDPSLLDAEGKKLGLPGRQRGDSNQNDTYSFFTFGVLYYFGDLKCPTIGRN